MLKLEQRKTLSVTSRDLLTLDISIVHLD